MNVTVGNSVLQKTDGCGGCDDAGARSVEEIGSGGGYVEFTVGEMGTFWVAGLNHGNAGTSYADIDFGIRFNGAGTADLLENGFYKGGDVPYSVGDVFRITVSHDVVYYRHNGTVIYTSQVTPTYPLVLDTGFGSMDATLYNAKLYPSSGGEQEPPSGEGFLETAGSQQSREKLTTTEIQAFLPTQKGAFRFPAPYITLGARLTDPGDCTNDADCVLPIGYSYWRRMNNHVERPDIFILLGLQGKGPTLFSFDKTTEAVVNLWPLFDQNNDPTGAYRLSEAEGWYFSAIVPNIVYTTVVYGGELERFDVEARQFVGPSALDLAQCVQDGVCPADSGWIQQAHSSDTDHVPLESQEADYHRQPKGNLDVTGEWFVWTTNTGGIGNRLDAFIVKVPKGLLMGN